MRGALAVRPIRNISCTFRLRRLSTALCRFGQGPRFGNAADRDPVVTPPDRSNHHEGIAILVEDYKLDSARAAGFSWISALSRFVKSASVDDVEPVVRRRPFSRWSSPPPALRHRFSGEDLAQ
jgi:hypothetical protein